MLVVALGQTTIVNYTFENTTTPVIGSSISSISWDSGATASYSAAFSAQSQALSIGSMANGNSFQVTLDASGLENIVFNGFRINGTAASPATWQLAYSLTGAAGTFTTVSSYALSAGTSVGATTLSGFNLPTGANNNSSVVISFLATTANKITGTGSASGTLHLDNLSFSATAVPEPSTYVLFLGLIALAGALIRRNSAARA